MSEDLKIRKETLEHSLFKLLKFIKDETEQKDAIEIYEQLITIIKADLTKFNSLNQNCSSCGEPLEAWEKKVCGSCKVADPKYVEEEDDFQY
jgi:transcription initiation factor IIE alpha subunit